MLSTATIDNTKEVGAFFSSGIIIEQQRKSKDVMKLVPPKEEGWMTGGVE